MSNKFKVGDKVKLKEDEYNSNLSKDKVYEVIDLWEHGIRIRDNSGLINGYYNERFELVKDNKKMSKIIVEVTRKEIKYGHYYFGDIGSNVYIHSDPYTSKNILVDIKDQSFEPKGLRELANELIEIANFLEGK